MKAHTWKKLELENTKKGFHFSGLKAWNEIPIELREIPSLYQFKRKLKAHLKSSKLCFPLLVF